LINGQKMQINAAQVRLREITGATVVQRTRLSVAEDRRTRVAPDAVSLSQALLAPEAWP
jgi:diamine N-acetyltransferase